MQCPIRYSALQFRINSHSLVRCTNHLPRSTTRNLVNTSVVCETKTENCIIRYPPMIWDEFAPRCSVKRRVYSGVCRRTNVDSSFRIVMFSCHCIAGTSAQLNCYPQGLCTQRTGIGENRRALNRDIRALPQCTAKGWVKMRPGEFKVVRRNSFGAHPCSLPTQRLPAHDLYV